jgi:acyl carrier protein
MEQLIDELRQEIVRSFKLEHLKWQEIDPVAPLFNEGLGLDSIDALELLVILEKNFKLKILPGEDGKQILNSVKSIAEYIVQRRSEGI